MKRKIIKQVTGKLTRDGAGVHLVRVLNRDTVKDFDPILMLDSFDSTNPDDYTGGFPQHPHRGIETISYLYHGKMVHRDSEGNEDAISDGEVQWMNSGSGILHEEMVPAADRLLGVQLWLNLPQKEKMSSPSYHKIRKEEIEEIEFDGGRLRLLAGQYKEHHGYKGEHLPLDYYDILIERNSKFELDVDKDSSIMLFTLLGEIYVDDELVQEKTAAKLSEGDKVEIITKDKEAHVLYIKSKALNEKVAWSGPIVMNIQNEIYEAYADLRNDNFLRKKIEY